MAIHGRRGWRWCVVAPLLFSVGLAINMAEEPLTLDELRNFQLSILRMYQEGVFDLGSVSPSSEQSVEQQQQPSDPELPTKLMLGFWEMVSGNRTVGAIFYDWNEGRAAIYYHDGTLNNFCRSVGNFGKEEMSCVVLMAEKKMFLVYPRSKFCCFCCDAEHGCAPPKPKFWKDIQFVREVTLTFRQKHLKVNVWRVGMANNEQFIYFENSETRVPVGLFVPPNKVIVMWPHKMEGGIDGSLDSFAVVSTEDSGHVTVSLDNHSIALWKNELEGELVCDPATRCDSQLCRNIQPKELVASRKVESRSDASCPSCTSQVEM